MESVLMPRLNDKRGMTPFFAFLFFTAPVDLAKGKNHAIRYI